MKISPAVFIFDFDGVIAASVTALYDTYDHFLQQYGHRGNQKEFDFLNGPKLADIISYLKETYKLPPREDELMLIYLNLLSSLYHRVNLYEGIEDVFSFLKERNYKIAIASSGKRKDITHVLEKFNLSSYIDSLFTGDDVSEAKPSPEIYNLAQSHYPNHEYYVIEDSKNGLEAAFVANTNTIFFNPDRRIQTEHILYEIHELSEIRNVVEEFELNCFTLAKTNNISLNLVNYNPTFSENQKDAIEKIWNQYLKLKQLFNGKIVCYKSHEKSNNVLSVECFITEYKFFFAQQNSSELDLGIMPIGVSGVIIDKNDNVLIAVRKNVTEYNGFYELAPSGGICSLKRKDKIILHEEQLIEELLEETEIKRDVIEAIEIFCFIFDKNDGVYDICSKLHVSKPLEQLLKNKTTKEYKNFEIVSLKDVKSKIIKNDCVPTSRVMLLNL